MALRVWLPLNGNTVNQGASKLRFSGTETDAAGKVASLSKLNSSFTVGGLVSDATINLGKKQSMFAWVYINSLMSVSNLGGALVGQHRYPSNQGMGLTIKYVSSTTGYLSINTGNGSSRTYNTYCGSTLLSANKWYHVGYTYDGTTVKLYVNGAVDGTYTITDMKIVADYVIVFSWSLNNTSGNEIYGNYKLNGRLNDVRVYDHCLSLKEVKQLARGLMVHYPLSRPNENLILNSSLTDVTPQWTVNDNTYGKLSRTVLAEGKQNSTQYTISALVKTTGNRNVAMYYFESSWSHGSASTGWQTTNGEWKVISITWITGSDCSNYTWYTQLYSQTDKINGEVYVAWMKLEKGPKATPWFPSRFENMILKFPYNKGTVVTSKATQVYGSSTSQYNYINYPPNAGGNYIGGRKYRIRFNVTPLNGSSIPTVTVLFYDLSSNTGDARYDSPVVNGTVDIIGGPNANRPNLLIYAGIAGATSGISMRLDNLVVYDEFIEEDISGYGNNAKAVNVNSVDTNSARYLSSPVFNGSTSFIKLPKGVGRPTDQVTYALWIYKTSSTSSKNPISCTEGGGWNIEQASYIQAPMYINGAYKIAISKKTWTDLVNGWHHITATYDGAYVRIYIDGVQSGDSVSASGSIQYYTNNTTFIGAEAGPSDSTPAGNYWDGRISDVRIYATALSATDVKELYESAASIDKSYNIHCYELFETGGEQVNIDKRGVLLLDQNKHILNNPPLSGSLTNWSGLVVRNNAITQRISDGTMTSSSFYIRDNEIIRFELSLKTSAYSSGSGIYIGTAVSSCEKVYYFNPTSKVYSEVTPGGTWDTYFLRDFKDTSVGTLITYIIGYDVPISKVPFITQSGFTGSTASNLAVIKLKQNIGSTYIRTGWNASQSTNEWTYYNLALNRFCRIIDNGLMEVNKLTVRDVIED